MPLVLSIKSRHNLFVTQKIPFTDPVLLALLSELLKEEKLPALDRWFQRKAKFSHWSAEKSFILWRKLCQCMTLAQYAAFQLQKNALPFPGEDLWPFLQRALKGHESFWIRTALQDTFGNTENKLLASGIPFWLQTEWKSRIELSQWSEDQQEKFLQTQTEAPPLYLRFHPSERGAAAKMEFQRGGELTEILPDIYLFEGKLSVFETLAWKNGSVEIQDAASQAVLINLDLKPGNRVWDVCAGRGGKTLAAASYLQEKGVLWATDISSEKLEALKQRAKKAQWSNIRIKLWDGNGVPDFGPEVANRKGFDKVIVDAPCSASGTWRRDPEGRYRIKPAYLKELHQHQSRLIRLGWQALKPGGRLLYVTCSWLVSENEEVVNDFVRKSNAELIRQEILGLPDFDANTMFYALLEKPHA